MSIKRYLLIGNYGVGNLGDEALKEYFLQTFPEVEWIVISGCNDVMVSPTNHDMCVSPFVGLRVTRVVPRLPFGWRSLWNPWWRTMREYARCDGVVFGGGSLFTDIESWKAPLLWWWHALVAWIFRKPIFLAFQGVGPFHTRIGEWCAKWVIQRSRFVSVRDRKSLERVQQWRRDVVESFDPVFISLCFLSPSPQPSPTRRERGVLVLIPRPNSDDAFFRRAHDLYTENKFDHIRVLSLQPSLLQEQTICNTIESTFPGCTHVLVHGYGELIREISQASFVLSERYHGALAALALEIPFETVAQAEGDKLTALKNFSKEAALILVGQGEKALRSSLNA